MFELIFFVSFNCIFTVLNKFRYPNSDRISEVWGRNKVRGTSEWGRCGERGGLHRAGGGADLGQGIKGGGAVLSDRIEDNLRVVHLH